MRVLILAALLLGSSTLAPCFAEEPAKPAVEAPQTTVPGRVEQKAEQPRDQRAGRDSSRADDRQMGPDWRMHRGDGARFGRDRSEMGPDGRMRGDGDRMGSDDRQMGDDRRLPGEGDRGDRGRYGGRGDRDWDYADRDKDDRSYFDEDRPRRRVKICVEYENGDEYCRYRR